MQCRLHPSSTYTLFLKLAAVFCEQITNRNYYIKAFIDVCTLKYHLSIHSVSVFIGAWASGPSYSNRT